MNPFVNNCKCQILIFFKGIVAEMQFGRESFCLKYQKLWSASSSTLHLKNEHNTPYLLIGFVLAKAKHIKYQNPKVVLSESYSMKYLFDSLLFIYYFHSSILSFTLHSLSLSLLDLILSWSFSLILGSPHFLPFIQYLDFILFLSVLPPHYIPNLQIYHLIFSLFLSI